MKRKLQWRGPHSMRSKVFGGPWGYWYDLCDNLEIKAVVRIEGYGTRALAKRIGNFLKKEAK